jgi:Cu+-exporting ATPase
MAVDPVCGMEVDPEKVAVHAEHEGVTYYFCSAWCREEFEKDPEKYVGGEERKP